jgi:hypothetical protein
MQTREKLRTDSYFQEIYGLKFILSSEANLYWLGTSYHEIVNGNLANVFTSKFAFRVITGK